MELRGAGTGAPLAEPVPVVVHHDPGLAGVDDRDRRILADPQERQARLDAALPEGGDPRGGFTMDVGRDGAPVDEVVHGLESAAAARSRRSRRKGWNQGSRVSSIDCTLNTTWVG